MQPHSRREKYDKKNMSFESTFPKLRINIPLLICYFDLDVYSFIYNPAICGNLSKTSHRNSHLFVGKAFPTYLRSLYLIYFRLPSITRSPS